ncbi:hypothetical protein BO221_14130 [Archangium sp. Cb G35]|uniref:hypothetical protein n=1 Tax=Archangium sp. Cb G35 TaxID=1920190 RepID=UPI0009373F8F|nr:hypothetical protein [Archangium sp. Cb G35]OJT24310.1 hypothetical protein BO221_14130 [Archangium sp. Cb G35]
MSAPGPTAARMARAAPSAARRRRQLRRITLTALGVALGASCPYWPADMAWVCIVVHRVAEALHAP